MRILPIVALTVLAVPFLAIGTAQAAISPGIEANGELLNTDVTPERQAATLDKIKAQGASIIRANIRWSDIAAACGGLPAAQLSNHSDACYDWTRIDGLVSGATSRGMQLLFSVSNAPYWLHSNTNTAYVGASTTEWKRTMSHYPAFMTAIVKRYNRSSEFGHVRYWTVWNEPNSRTFWAPQTSRAQINLAPARYAALYGVAAPAVKAANARAVVAPGPTGPKSSPWKPVPYIKAVQRALPKYLPGRTIAQKRTYIGAWAHNPYADVWAPTGNPKTGRSFASGQALGIAQTKDLIKLLDSAAITKGKQVWATEFGWETNPPDRLFGVSLALQARYLSEAYDLLDRTNRVTIGIWYGLTDPEAALDFQSGTYTAAGRAKPSLSAYRRMLSVSAPSVRRGTNVQIYSRANTNRRATRIMYSTNNRNWKMLPLKGRRSDGSIRVNVRMTQRLYFSTWDGSTRGPSRIVSVR